MKKISIVNCKKVNCLLRYLKEHNDMPNLKLLKVKSEIRIFLTIKEDNVEKENKLFFSIVDGLRQ